MPPELVSIAELARRVGVTRRAVVRAIEDGRITGAVTQKSSGTGKPWNIDSAKAIRLWKMTTNISHRPQDELNERARKATGLGQPNPSPGEQEIGPYQDPEDGSFANARARRELALAELKEMEVKRERGESLDRKKTLAAIFAIVRSQRESLRNFSARLCGPLAANDDPASVRVYLDLEMQKVLDKAADDLNGIAGDS